MSRAQVNSLGSVISPSMYDTVWLHYLAKSRTRVLTSLPFLHLDLKVKEAPRGGAETETAMSVTSMAAYLARRAAQKERVRILYRRALKDTLNWAVHRHLFYDDVSSIADLTLLLTADLAESFNRFNYIAVSFSFFFFSGFEFARKVRGKQTCG